MPDNYYKTAIRNYDAAIELHGCSHYYVSCYLCGYVIECYSKILIEKFTLHSQSGHNLNSMSQNIIRILTNPSLSGRLPSKYVIDLRSVCPTIIFGRNKWHASRRYDDDETYWNDSIANRYTAESYSVKRMLVTMKLDGVI